MLVFRVVCHTKYMAIRRLTEIAYFLVGGGVVFGDDGWRNCGLLSTASARTSKKH